MIRMGSGIDGCQPDNELHGRLIRSRNGRISLRRVPVSRTHRRRRPRVPMQTTPGKTPKKEKTGKGTAKIPKEAAKLDEEDEDTKQPSQSTTSKEKNKEVSHMVLDTGTRAAMMRMTRQGSDAGTPCKCQGRTAQKMAKVQASAEASCLIICLILTFPCSRILHMYAMNLLFRDCNVQFSIYGHNALC